MYLLDGNVFDCCGCSSCKQICPEDCITLKLSGDKFYYPVIDSNQCIRCGACETVCPIVLAKSNEKNEKKQNCFYGWHKDEKIRHESTSGGAFSAIAESFLTQDKSWVYGAVYDENMRVCHQAINNVNQIGKLRQSKYVQSSIDWSFAEIKAKLKDNDKVLFCGTPCQVHGLQAYLKKTYDNLMLVDFICHGVASPLALEKYINSINRTKYPIRKIRFRDKVRIGNAKSLSCTTVIYENMKKKSGIDLYLQAYMKGLMQRSSCEVCPYATLYRWSDITMGDFWGIEDCVSRDKIEFHKGISLLLTNSVKGLLFLKRTSSLMFISEVDILWAVNGKNEQLIKPLGTNKNKAQFYRDLDRMNIKIALLRGIGLKSTIMIYLNQCKFLLKAYMPKRLHDFLYNVKCKYITTR